ncbi:unnamed protein product [Pelagomonas calceolata]|uniref:Uncharacterized protein n=1 Tax=Pelagomonas calceolata TaxID=35677 RepID=A0A8J2WX09_9STRA|nr:unnamed protein product [Pelagomonas calceolata]
MAREEVGPFFKDVGQPDPVVGPHPIVGYFFRRVEEAHRLAAVHRSFIYENAHRFLGAVPERKQHNSCAHARLDLDARRRHRLGHPRIDVLVFRKRQAEVELPPHSIRHLQQYAPRPSIDEEHHRVLAAVDRRVVDKSYLLEGVLGTIDLLAVDGLEHERCRLTVRERCQVAGHGECLGAQQCAEQAVPYSHAGRSCGAKAYWNMIYSQPGARKHARLEKGS